jgi:tight adherence protein C
MSAWILFIVGAAGIFTALFLSLTAVGVFTNEARGVSKSLAVVEAFSAAPAAMQKELEPSFNDRVLTPLLNRFTGIGKRISPSDHADRIRKKLDIAGNPSGWSVERVEALKFVGVLSGTAVALLFALFIGLSFAPAVALVVGGAVAGYFGPNMYLYQKGYDRTARMQKDLPDALDLLTISVEAGLGFDSALAQVARNTQGPLADEFGRVLQEMQIGLGRSAALRALGDRSSLPTLRSFASAMVQADSFGIPVGQVLRVQSEEMRLKRRQRAEEQAQKVPVKILLPLMACILPVLFLIVIGPAVIALIDLFGGGGIGG